MKQQFCYILSDSDSDAPTVQYTIGVFASLVDLATWLTANHLTPALTATYQVTVTTLWYSEVAS